MSLYVALLANSATYLESTLKVVRRALLGSANESVPTLLPSSISPAERAKATPQLLQLATVGNEPVARLLGALFDNFMEHLLSDIVAYVNASEERKLAAAEHKQRVASAAELTAQMSARVKELALERDTQHHVQHTSALREIATLQSRVLALELELREAQRVKGGAATHGSCGPHTVATGCVLVAVECPSAYFQKEHALRAACAAQADFSGDAAPFQTAAERLQQYREDVSAYWRALEHAGDGATPHRIAHTLGIAAFNSLPTATAFVERVTSATELREREVDVRAAIYVVPPSAGHAQASTSSGLAGGAHTAACLRLLRSALEAGGPGCVASNVATGIRPACFDEIVVGACETLSAFLPHRSCVWRAERRAASSNAMARRRGDADGFATAASVSGWLFPTIERLADEAERGCAPCRLPVNGPHRSCFVVALQATSAPATAAGVAELTSLIREKVWAADAPTPLDTLIELAAPVPQEQSSRCWRFFVASSDAQALAAAAARCLTAAECCCHSGAPLQAAIVDVGSEVGDTASGVAIVGADEGSDIRVVAPVAAALDAMLSIAGAGEVAAAPGVARALQLTSPACALRVVPERELRTRRCGGADVKVTLLRRRVVPDAVQRRAALPHSPLSSKGVQQPLKGPPSVAIAACGLGCAPWLEECDPVVLSEVLLEYEKVLHAAVVAHRGAFLSYDAADGGCLLAFEAATDAVGFASELHARLLNAAWGDAALRYRELAEVRLADGTLLFRGPRACVGVAVDRCEQAMVAAARALELADCARGGETTTHATVATLCYGSGVAVFDDRFDGTCDSAAAAAAAAARAGGTGGGGSGLSAETTLSALPSALRGRRTAWMAPPTASPSTSAIGTRRILRRLRIADAAGMCLHGAEQALTTVSASTRHGPLLPPISPTAAQHIIMALRQRAWRPAEIISPGLGHEAPRLSRIFATREVPAGAVEESRNSEPVLSPWQPPLRGLPLTFERYCTLRRAFEGMNAELAALRDDRGIDTAINAKNEGTEEEEEALRATVDAVALRAMHTKIHSQLSPYMPRTLADLRPLEGANAPEGESSAVKLWWTFEQVVRFYFPDVLDEVLDELAKQWAAQRGAALARQLRHARASAPPAGHPAAAVAHRRSSGPIMNAADSERLRGCLDELHGTALEDVEDAEALCRALLRDVATERLRFLALSFAAAGKEREARAEREELLNRCAEQQRRIEQLASELADLRTLTHDVAHYREQLRESKAAALMAEARLKRTIATAHYATHALGGVLGAFADGATAALRASHSPTDEAAAEATAVASAAVVSEQQVLDEYGLLFSSVQQDSLDPFSNPPPPRPRNITALPSPNANDGGDGRQERDAAHNPRAFRSVARSPSETAPGTPHEQLLLSMVAALHRPADALLRVRRAAAAATSTLGSKVSELRGELAAVRATVAQQAAHIATLTSELQSGSSAGAAAVRRQEDETVAEDTPETRADSLDLTKDQRMATNCRPFTIGPAHAPRGHCGAADVACKVAVGCAPAEPAPCVPHQGAEPSPPPAGVAPHTAGQPKAHGEQPHQQSATQHGTVCEACLARPAELVCAGCWGANLCRRCVATLHSFLPSTLLRRAHHIVESDASLADVGEKGEIGFDAASRLMLMRLDHHVLMRRLPGSAGRGPWTPRDPGKALMISTMGLGGCGGRPGSPFRALPLPQVEAVEAAPLVLPRHPTADPVAAVAAATCTGAAAATLGRKRPSSATGGKGVGAQRLATVSPPRPAREERVKRR